MADHLSILDTAENVVVEERLIESRSSYSDRGLVIRLDRGSRPVQRELTLSWETANEATRALIQQHFETNRHRQFSVLLPGGGSVPVIYSAAPRFRPRSKAAWRVSVAVEEAFAILNS